VSFSQYVTDLEAEGAYAVLARAQALEQQGRSIIHLEIGQPDFATFPAACQSGIEAIQSGYTRYSPPAGLPELRQAIATDVGQRRGIAVHPSQVVVGPGAKPALFFAALALINPGNEVLYPDPGFPTYGAMIRVAGGVPIPVPLQEERQFSFDLNCLADRMSDRTKLMVLNSPANPTGGVIPQSDLEYIAALALQHNCWVISDEIYARLCYDGLSAPTIAAIPGMAERTVIVDGFSKTYAMTGWRLGYGIMPISLAERVELLLTHAVGCTATFTQWAGVSALTGDQGQVDQMVVAYQQRRDRMAAGLNAISGICCQVPQGAFYAFPNVKALGLPVKVLAQRLLDEAGVAVLPGTDFGSNGEGYLRLCYATSPENIDLALERIEAWCNRNRPSG
jgi:aspartate/methionine/tyrosine aminotransferase